jgi:hypothetical protein
MAYSDRAFQNFLKGSESIFGSQSKAGAQNLGAAGDYFQTLLSGDRTALARSVMPQANQGIQMADAAKRQAAQTGARTGGGTALQQQSEDQLQQNLMTLIGQSQQGAAQGAAQVGSIQDQTSMAALAAGIKAAQEDIQQRNAAKMQLLGSIIGAAGGAVGAGLYGHFSKA